MVFVLWLSERKCCIIKTKTKAFASTLFSATAAASAFVPASVSSTSVFASENHFVLLLSILGVKL